MMKIRHIIRASHVEPGDFATIPSERVSGMVTRVDRHAGSATIWIQPEPDADEAAYRISRDRIAIVE